MKINIDTEKFIRDNIAIDSETEEHFDLIQQMEKDFISIGVEQGWQHGPVGGAPCQLDLRFIYLMTLLLKPKNIIEVGTWSGLSAHVIALAASRHTSEFRIDTCDVVGVYQKPEQYAYLNKNIHFHNCHSVKMHEQLKTSGIKYDFIFSDASLSIRDCHLISDILADKSNLFFMTHDVYPNKYEKGNRALDIFADNYSLEDDMYKFIPSKLDIGYEVQNTKINSCTGFVASHRCYNSIVNNLGRQNGSE